MDADVTGSGGIRRRTGRRLPRLATAAFLAVVGGFTLASQGPPRPAGRCPGRGLLGRGAMRHVEAIAREPHPLGSAAEEPVRAYIIDELKETGPRARDPAPPRLPRARARADVQSLAARRASTSSPDGAARARPARRPCCSRPTMTRSSAGRGPATTPRASRRSSKPLRALKAGPAPERDIIILINDGEEAGLYGADVFAAEHPWAEDVGVVLNFDARGNSGPSFMFETSDGNGWLIEQMARALPHPMASSLTIEVYRLMPNDTRPDHLQAVRHGRMELRLRRRAVLLSLARGHAGEPRPADAPAPGGEPAGDGAAPGPARPGRRPPRGRGVLLDPPAVRGDLSEELGDPAAGHRRAGVSSRCWRWAWRRGGSGSRRSPPGSRRSSPPCPPR